MNGSDETGALLIEELENAFPEVRDTGSGILPEDLERLFESHRLVRQDL
ncbi:MAG: hypothetical protein ABIE42_07225 [Candidatus Eisenbacteria bacterium]